MSSVIYSETFSQLIDFLFGIIWISSCVIGLMAALLSMERLFSADGW